MIRQHPALSAPLHGLQLIEASAGTGKTWTISGLFVRLVLQAGLQPDQILTMTFTRAATAELRERIRQRLRGALLMLQGEAVEDEFLQALRQDNTLPEELLQTRAEAALRGFDDAAIHTIHGFCQRALSDRAFSGGLPFRAELLQDTSEQRRQLVTDFWRRHIATPAASDGQRRFIAWLLQSGESPDTLDEWLRHQLSRHGVIGRNDPPADLDAHAGAIARSWQALRTQAATLGDFERWLEQAPLNRRSYTKANVPKWLAQLRDWLSQPEATPASEPVQRFSSEYLTNGAKADFDLPALVVALDAVLAAQGALTRAYEQHWRALRLDLLDACRVGLSAELAEHGLQSFDDLLTRLHQALHSPHGPTLAALLRERYRAALIDEFQDTDQLQWEVLARIYQLADGLAGSGETGDERGQATARSPHESSPLPPGEGSGVRAFPDVGSADPWRETGSDFDSDATGYLAPYDDAPMPGEQFALDLDFTEEPPAAPAVFLVGDPKQAIYSFRGADVYAYLSAVQRCTQRHDLLDNQRSVAPLVRALNRVFAPAEDGSTAFRDERIAYHPVSPGSRPRPQLIDHGETDPAPLRLHLMPVQHSAKGEEKTASKEAASDWAASETAAEVRRLLDAAAAGQIRLGDEPLRAGDIAILVNSHRRAEAVRQALAEAGIVAAIQSQLSVYQTSEAEGLLRVLRAVASPSHEPSLRAALVTDLLGFDGHALHALREDESLWTPQLDRFARWNERWRQHGFIRMFRELLRDAAVPERLAAFRDGERRLTNLLHLGELLQAESGRQRGPEALIAWLATRHEDNTREETQLRLESDASLVQVLTIHRSKGLEYPIVFAPYLWDASDFFDLQDLILHHEPGTDAEPGNALVLEGRVAQLANARLIARDEALAERLRLAYVALTRASHRCHLFTGNINGLQHSALGWLLLRQRDASPGHDEQLTRLQQLISAEPASFRLHQAAAAASTGPLTDTTLPALATRPLPAIPAGLIVTSFTQLLRDVEREHADTALLPEPLPDHDQGAPAPIGVIAPREPGGSAARFPRGAAAGTCLHSMLENMAFGADRQDWLKPISEALTLAGYPEDWAPEVALWMQQIVQTPLHGADCRLSDLAPGDVLSEMEFCLPSHALPPRALSTTLRQHGVAASQLAGQRVHGFLKGFIDLVFVHQGRYWIVDYKSNDLGETADAYGEAALAAEMAHADYNLQAILYQLALRRWLRWKHPADGGDRLGGAIYLFLRGMDPSHPGRGVHLMPSNHALLDALDALFEGQ